MMVLLSIPDQEWVFSTEMALLPGGLHNRGCYYYYYDYDLYYYYYDYEYYYYYYYFCPGVSTIGAAPASNSHKHH